MSPATATTARVHWLAAPSSAALIQPLIRRPNPRGDALANGCKSRHTRSTPAGTTGKM